MALCTAVLVVALVLVFSDRVRAASEEGQRIRYGTKVTATVGMR